MPPFEKGQPRPPNAGRRAGTPNKFTQLKLDFLAALDAIDKKKGRVAVITALATAEPEIFWRLIGKLIPSSVMIAGDEDGAPVQIVTKRDLPSMTNAYAALLRGERVMLAPPDPEEVEKEIAEIVAEKDETNEG